MIDCTIVINLERHTNRKNDMTEKIKKVNIQNYLFYRAVDGETDLLNYNFQHIPGWIEPFKCREITVGEIGCALSHYNIWNYIIDNKINKTLILEDDVIFENNFNYFFNKVQLIDFDYDLFYLGRNPFERDNLKEQIVNEFAVKPKTSYNAHSYIITYECAKKLIRTNYLNHLLPVDDFLSIMYDEDYPFKEYSKYFKNAEKIKAFSLMQNIVSQNTHYYGSSIDESILYNNIKENNKYINKTNMSTWTIDLKPKYSHNMDKYTSSINHFFDFSEKLNLNFYLNLKNDTFCFIEKIIYDNITFHAKRLNVTNLNNKHISFWSKKHEYDFNYIHMHVDHCDYESIKHNTEFKKPIFTSIIYFDDNNCPTLITEVTRDMYNNKSFYQNNDKLIFSFPKVLKNVVFDSGKYYHGESYLSDYKITERKSIVIAVWDEDNKPFHIPYFDKHFFHYFLFVYYNKSIDDNEYDEFNKTEELIQMTNRDNTIITLPINDSSLINEDFFDKLIIKREKQILYRFAEIFKKIKNPDTVVLDFSNLLINKSSFSNMNCYIEPFKIISKIDIIKETRLINELLLITEEYMLDTSKTIFTMIEKYVHGISMFHTKLLNKTIDDICVTFKIINKNHNGANIYEQNDNAPLLSCITYLEESVNPIILSDIDIDSYKYKDFDNKKLCLIIPNKNIHIAFSGGNYYHNYNSNTLLIIHLWKKKTILNIKKYYNPSDNVYTINNSTVSIQSIKQLPKQLYIKDEELFEDLLYKKENKNYFFETLLKDEIANENIFIVNVSKDSGITSDIVQKPNKEFKKMKFII